MNANEYQCLAARTLIDRPDFPISDRDIMLVWNAMGLAGETGELLTLVGEMHGKRISDPERKACREKLPKEIGDCFWYAAAICTKIDVDFESLFLNQTLGVKGTKASMPMRLAGAMGAIVEHIKKGVFHQHGVNTLALSLLVRDYVFALVDLCYWHGFEVADVWNENIEKLKRRYPAGFNSKDSINREAGNG